MAVIKFISDLRLLGGAVIEKARLENLPTSSAPASPALGQMYFDTTTQKVTVWATVSGTPQWVAVGTDAADISALETRVAAIENAPYASEGFVTGITDALDTRLDTAESELVSLDGRLDTAESELVSLDGRLDTAESELVSLDGRLDTAESELVSLDGRLDTAESELVSLDGRLDTAESELVSLDGRLDTAESELVSLDGRLDTIESAPYATEGFVTGITDGLDTRIDSIENAPYASEGFVTGITDGLDTRIDAIENAPYATEGFVTGITDGHDTRIAAIENAPYASEGYADSAASAAVQAHDANVNAHPMGIKWFTPTQIINGDLSTTVAAQTDVALSTSDTIVASFSAADPLGWLEFSGNITVDGTGSVTFDVEIQDDLSGVAPMGTLTVTRGVASDFSYMIQAPATGVAKDYDLVIRTQAGSETADFSIIDVDAFGSDPFVVRSELQGEIGALDTRIDAIENAPYVINADFTITGDDIETEFTSPNIASDVYPAVSVWDNATGSLVLVDVTRSYSAGPDWTTLTISFNEAPADGATYRVAVKI